VWCVNSLLPGFSAGVGFVLQKYDFKMKRPTHLFFFWLLFFACRRKNKRQAVHVAACLANGNFL